MPLVIPGLEKDLEKGSWIGEVIRSINSTDYYLLIQNAVKEIL